MDDSAPVVLLFESYKGRNAAGGSELLPDHPRHGKLGSEKWDYYAMTNELVYDLSRGESRELRWRPVLKRRSTPP